MLKPFSMENPIVGSFIYLIVLIAGLIYTSHRRSDPGFGRGKRVALPRQIEQGGALDRGASQRFGNPAQQPACAEKKPPADRRPGRDKRAGLQAAFFSSRNSRRKILPTLVFGNSSRNSMNFGFL